MPGNRSPHLVTASQVFTRLTVLGFSHNDKRDRRHYTVICECGTRQTVQGTLLRSGNTKSCGCLSRETKLARRLPNDAGVIGQIILQYKRHAKDRDIEFHLSRDEVDAIVRKPCHYCGVAGSNLKKTKNLRDGFAHNGIDRVDSSLPYVSDNVVPCCGLCNRIKRDLPRSEFIAWAVRVANHQRAMADQWGAIDVRMAA